MKIGFRSFQKLRSLAAVSVGAFMAAAVPVHAQGQQAPKAAPPAVSPVPLANFTQFTDGDLGDYLARNLKPEIQNALRDRGLVVVATTLTFDFDGRNACFASIGVAEAPPKGRNPRVPANSSQGWEFGATDDCAARQMRSAVSSLNDTPLQKILNDVEKTAGVGGSRQQETPNTDIVRLERNSTAGYDAGPFSDQLHSFRLGEALDYRHVATHVQSWSTRFNSGKLMCVAQAGFTGRSPDGRNSRIPASRNAHAVLRDGGDRADCEQAAALGAVKKLMRDPWVGKEGRLNGFERAREDGVPLPDLRRVAAVEKQLVAASQPAARPVAARSTQVNRSTCTNQCVNGDCVRTFPDGTKERWQAPRRFDPISGNWTWDTNSCGG